MDACSASDSGTIRSAGGCRAPVGGGVCGETKTLDIVKEFRRLYEEKMKEVEEFGGGDNLELKMKLQQEWIRDLSEQNEMLVRAVEELEYEATGRVQMLEDKLQQSANCICEVMNKYRQYDVTNEILAEPLEKIFRLENDQKNLLEFIRRIREGNQWQYEGLKFYEISYKDLFGSDENPHKYLINEGLQEQEKNKEKEKLIEGLEKKLNHFYAYGDIDAMKKELICKRDECETLKQTMVDTRQALTEEVAQKHDMIIQLKKENQELEERCIQSDKQTAFRDDIIKELRKEIKQLKQQLTQNEIDKLYSTIDDLEKQLQHMKLLQEEHDKVKEGEIAQLKHTIINLEIKLQEAEEKKKMCNMCKGKLKVGFMDNEEVQATPDHDDQQLEHMELLEKRDQIIRVQNETLSLIQGEMEMLKLSEAEATKLKQAQSEEIRKLHARVSELEEELGNCGKQSANLQMAVDFYKNSINVLEAAEEKYKLEINQQKLTISNLQKALVTVKQDLDLTRQRSEENVSLGWASRWFGASEPKPANGHKPVHDI